jgi:hypothetical protein
VYASLTLLGILPNSRIPTFVGGTAGRPQYERTCSIHFSLPRGFVRQVQTPTALESPLGQRARGASRQAMRVSSAEDERSAAMAVSPADSVNGISILK